MADRKIVFIAFAIEDERQRDFLKGQSLGPRAPYETVLRRQIALSVHKFPFLEVSPTAASSFRPEMRRFPMDQIRRPRSWPP